MAAFSSTTCPVRRPCADMIQSINCWVNHSGRCEFRVNRLQYVSGIDQHRCHCYSRPTDCQQLRPLGPNWRCNRCFDQCRCRCPNLAGGLVPNPRLAPPALLLVPGLQRSRPVRGGLKLHPVGAHHLAQSLEPCGQSLVLQRCVQLRVSCAQG